MHLQLTVGKRIALGFSVVLAISAAIGVFAPWKASQIRGDFIQISAVELPAQREILSVHARVEEILGSAYKHIHGSDAAEKSKFEAIITNDLQQNTAALSAIDKLVENDAERAIFSRINSTRSKYREAMNRVLEQSRQAMTPAQSAVVHSFARAEFDPAAAAYVYALQEYVAESKRQVERSTAAASGAIANLYLFTVAAGILSLIIGGALSAVISRGVARSLKQVTNTLKEAASQVSSAASQVSAASQALSEGSCEQAASLEETTASLEEVNRHANENADNGAQAAKLITEKAAPNFRILGDRASNMQTAISSAVEASSKTSQIIKTIDEIAFQTNILALNAAVEAARAGEAGAGFAVVADEVRSLAQRAAEAARQTADLIDESNRRINDARSLNAELTQVLATNLSVADDTAKIVNRIAGASQEQATCVAQVGKAVTEIDKVTQANAGHAEETAATAEELNGQAAALLENIRVLATLVDGTPESARGDAAAAGERPQSAFRSRANAAEAHSARRTSGGTTAAGTIRGNDARPIKRASPPAGSSRQAQAVSASPALNFEDIS